MRILTDRMNYVDSSVIRASFDLVTFYVILQKKKRRRLKKTEKEKCELGVTTSDTWEEQLIQIKAGDGGIC